jgi:hypothetical protein
MQTQGRASGRLLPQSWGRKQKLAASYYFSRIQWNGWIVQFPEWLKEPNTVPSLILVPARNPSAVRGTLHKTQNSAVPTRKNHQCWKKFCNKQRSEKLGWLLILGNQRNWTWVHMCVRQSYLTPQNWEDRRWMKAQKEKHEYIHNFMGSRIIHKSKFYQ